MHPPALHRQSLGAGVYGLSNASLDTPWPKTQRLKQAALASLEHLRDNPAGRWTDPLAQALFDDHPAPDSDMPRTGVPGDAERALSSAFVRMPERAYGTRSSLVVSARPAAIGWQVDLMEWTHDHALRPSPGLPGEPHQRMALIWS